MSINSIKLKSSFLKSPKYNRHSFFFKGVFMKLRDLIKLYVSDFNLIINGVKCINNKGSYIPESILNMEVEKIDGIDIYLC